MNKYLILIFILGLSTQSCDSGVQTKKKIKKDPVIQNSEEKPIVSPEAVPIVQDSLNVDLLLARGSEYYINKDYEKAFNQFIAAYQIDEKNITAILGVGNIYYDTQQNTKAIEFYQKALELDPNKLDVRCDMATCYFRVGMLDKAIEINKKTIEMDFNHAQSHHNLAVFYKNMGKQQEAEAEVKIYNQLISSQQN